MRKSTALLAAAGAVALSAVVLPAMASTTAPLSWAACPAGTGVDPRQECATVSAPLDYGVPDGRHTNLRVSRIATAVASLRRGVLLLIPGGPGGSGLNRPSAVVSRLPGEVRDRYDIVSFDPRGVGASTPVSCDLADDDVVPAHLLPWPAPDGDISANVARARRIAAGCAANGGPLLDHISSRIEASDIDTIRAALGERRLSLWGVSYGTYVGAVYATLYPGHTDRVLLDSNDDPNPQLVARGWLANYAVGDEDRFPDFAAWAAARDTTYHLGGDPAAVRATFLTLGRQLDAAPLPWPGASPPQLDGNALRATLLNALYSDTSFPPLAALARAALAGGPLPATTTPPIAALQNSTAVVFATICNDVAWPHSTDGYVQAVAANRAAYPLTAGMPVNVSACTFWAPPAQPPVRVTSRGPSNVLLVQNLRDPATPYQGALRMRAAFGARARMVAVDSGGHEAYLANGNTCGDQRVTAFLAYGQRPANDMVCH